MVVTLFIPELEKRMVNYVETNELNFLNDFNGMQIFSRPLIGVAASSDPLWKNLKNPEVVHPNHLTPLEWMPEAKSVISYFLPFTEDIRRSNRINGQPSQEWLYGRYDGEIFNNSLRSLIVEILRFEGVKAMAPALDVRFSISNHVSNWSERHVAFISGLGTFSLSYSLITNLGTAGRFGSVIVDKELEPTPRPYQEIDEYCDGCGNCILRCPSHAITGKGKDKESCFNYINSILKLNESWDGCGKCQTRVPCEFKNPNRAIK